MKRNLILFYKYIIIFFFKIFNAKIKIIKDNKVSNYKKDINVIESNNLRIYTINRGKIFTNSVDDAAYLYKDNILETPSYQYRNSLQSNIKNNYVLKNGTPKILKTFNKTIVSLISGGACKHNYGHWLFDTISRFYILKKKKIIKSNFYFYIPSLKYNFQKETFKHLKINQVNLISSEKNKFISGKKIICTTHPFDHKFENITKEIIIEFKKNFLSIKNKSKIKTYEKIFINRDYENFDFKRNLNYFKNHRILINHHEVQKYLENKNFKTFKLSKLSIADQVKIFYEAKIIISMFGAELSNLVFCKPKTKIIEIKNNNLLQDYQNLCKQCDLIYYPIQLKPIIRTKVKQNGILLCPTSKIDIALQSLL